VEEVEMDEIWSKVCGSREVSAVVGEKIEAFALLMRKARESHVRLLT
jgi:hypothetical protein